MPSTVDPAVYNADYYRSSNYADYLERSDRYKKTAFELAGLFQAINLVQKDSLVVDYGCAVGFLMEGLKEVGYTRVVGVEVSEWARTIARAKPLPVLPSIDGLLENPELLISMDVFEHMTDEEITGVMRKSKPKALLVRIPTSTDEGKTFHLEVSRADPTHINCKTKDQWIEFFKRFGYETFFRLSLYTIYDTPGVTCLLIL